MFYIKGFAEIAFGDFLGFVGDGEDGVEKMVHVRVLWLLGALSCDTMAIFACGARVNRVVWRENGGVYGPF